MVVVLIWRTTILTVGITAILWKDLGWYALLIGAMMALIADLMAIIWKT